jgi:nucleotide-binding universal stress UspA family protein
MKGERLMIEAAARRHHHVDDGASSLELIKNVLVGLTTDVEQEPPSSAVPYALSLAVQARAHLTVLSASIQLGLTHGGVSRFAQSLVDAENKKLRDVAEAAAEAARQAASAAAVVCDVRTPQLDFDRLLTAFIRQARTHDLIALDAEPVTLALDRSLIEGILCDSGRPLIVVPQGQQPFSCRTIVVAWDGSAKAARALNDALPLLGAAERIELVTIAGEKDLSESVPGAEAARHLARHGHDVDIVELAVEHGDVAETLRRRAIEARADLMVMGAFVHARIRQFILGGTTQSLLRSSPVPLFLSY